MAARDVREIDQYERRLRAEGFALIAGVDEAGRGALAGPLVAAAVILPASFDCAGLKDSKELTAEERAEWFERIDRTAWAWAVRRARCGPRATTWPSTRARRRCARWPRTSRG